VLEGGEEGIREDDEEGIREGDEEGIREGDEEGIRGTGDHKGRTLPYNARVVTTSCIVGCDPCGRPFVYLID